MISGRFICYLRSSLSPRCRLFSNYESSISLKKLYPNSSLNFSAPAQVPETTEPFSGYVPIDKLDITYSRSAGPGGQNVNKVNTKVDVRFHVETADWLSEEVKKCILDKHKTKINKDGYLIVRSDKTRSQIHNQADAMMMLRRLIRQSIKVEPVVSEETELMLRMRKERANRVRLLLKRNHSLKKQERQHSGEF